MSKQQQDVQETCSCGAGVVAPQKYALKWRAAHIHGDVRNVESATQIALQHDDTESSPEDSNNKIGFQPNP